jgi:uncharacterized protein YecE (DUF72 family)
VNKIYLGTSGYSYQDWKGYFYPPDIKNNDFLIYYSGIFNTVELNFTYYALQRSSVFYSLAAKVEGAEDFIFSLKANQIFTHQRSFSDSDVRDFLDSIKPLAESGRLGCILFQFPYSFYFNRENLNFISLLGKRFEGYEICAEFRNSEWVNSYTMETLKLANFCFCNVDEPSLSGLLKPSSIVTAESAYIRFHGRNASKWWNCEKAYQRYDYMYGRNELEEWVPRLNDIFTKAKKTYVYFNNHYKGKAPKSAQLLLDLLKNIKNMENPGN